MRVAHPGSPEHTQAAHRLAQAFSALDAAGTFGEKGQRYVALGNFVHDMFRTDFAYEMASPEDAMAYARSLNEAHEKGH